MIRYSLHCANDHSFEGWFGSSQDFDRQNGMGLVSCPVCSSVEVEKSLMAPAVSTSRKREETRAVAEAAARAEAPVPAEATAAGLSQKQREMLSQMRELRDKILSGADNVGERFPEEARKIHYGEAKARGIYGKTSVEEAVRLAEEGIDLLPLPDLPEDKN